MAKFAHLPWLLLPQGNGGSRCVSVRGAGEWASAAR